MSDDKLQNSWLWISVGDLKTEFRQLEEEGRNVSRIAARFAKMTALDNQALAQDTNQARARELLDDGQRLSLRAGFPHVEPSDLAGIRKLRPREGVRRFAKQLPDKVIRDRIHGAWLGRCAGCLLGKPVEGVRSDDLWPFLEATGQFPIADYLKLSFKGPIAKRFEKLTKRTSCENVNYMPIDDDTNYTVAGLLIMEKKGIAFTPVDVAQFWMGNLPMLATCTAERVAYRNFAEQIGPPRSAVSGNPYREWIGAQIRADAFGYVAVGNMALAAEFAWRDACISHVKNGIYGEMFVSSMLAAAPYCRELEEVIEAGLSEIPKNCRLASDVKTAIGWYRSGLSYDKCVANIHERWDEHQGHDWCHTNSNAVICVVALLYCDGDFGKAICRAVQPCFDTDCNGATVGSIMGMRLGARNLPTSWIARLNDTLHTSLADNNVVKISDMAERTYRVYKGIGR